MDPTAIQVLAAMALVPSSTFEHLRGRLDLPKEQLSRALHALASSGLIEASGSRYFRGPLPPVTAAGMAVLEKFLQVLSES